MKEFHPFYFIGTLGVLITAIVNIILALGFSLTAANSTFFIIYPTFVAFLIIGVALTVKEQKDAANRIE